MGLFKRKKKEKPRFGANIKPSCSYCAYRSKLDSPEICAAGNIPVDDACKKFLYNPLLRDPVTTPKLKTGAYSAKDFSLD